MDVEKQRQKIVEEILDVKIFMVAWS